MKYGLTPSLKTAAPGQFPFHEGNFKWFHFAATTGWRVHVCSVNLSLEATMLMQSGGENATQTAENRNYKYCACQHNPDTTILFVLCNLG